MSEDAARQITAAARATRKSLPRGLWIVAIAVAVVCAGALAIGWLTAPDASSTVPARTPAATGGLDVTTYRVIGVALGLGVGIAIGRRSR